MKGSPEVFKGTGGSICLRSAPELALEKPLLEADNPDVMCRICHQQCDEPLLSPCWCAGSVQFVCRQCLKFWRSTNEKKSLTCELCGFAFLYETERVPTWQVTSLIITRSSRCFILLAIASLYVFISIGGTQIGEPFTLWFAGLIWYQIGSDVISYAGSWDPPFGSLGYSLKRLWSSRDADSMDAWALHKAEWARFGIRPIEANPGAPAPLLTKLPKPLHPLGGILIVFPITFGGFVLVGSFIVWSYAHGFFVSFFSSKRGVQFEAYVVSPILVTGVTYLAAAAVLHAVSMCRTPPLRLVMDEKAQPCIRSLHSHEKRSRVLLAV